MRRIICVLVGIGSIISLYGQDRVEVSEELIRLQKAPQEVKGRDAESILQLVDIYERLLVEYYQHCDRFRDWNRGIETGTLYSLACYQSLSGMTQRALLSFGQAVDKGWNKYRHALHDSDLDPIREEPGFIKIMENLRDKWDYITILQRAGKYDDAQEDALPAFTYQGADHPDLVRVREYFQLDTVAGKGDEISRIKNLMTWTHNLIRHDGNSSNPAKKNAIDLYELCVAEERGVNCRMLAQFLNECYLAMGFKSRYVTCMPERHDDNDCHVINAVYCETLGKWIWMDPSFNAWVMDGEGNLLGIEEVRERLIADLPLTLNEDANWNNKNPQTKEYYIDVYMAKNLYYFSCRAASEYDAETIWEGKPNAEYVDLLPQDYTSAYKGNHTTSNAGYFWQKP